MSSQRCVLAIGSINLDLQVKADGWPEQSETLLGREFLCAGGGKAANVAAFAAKLGIPSQLIGRVGDDSFAELALAGLRSLRVNLDGVSPVRGPTAVSMIVVRDDGDKTILLAPNANEQWESDAERSVRAAVERCAPGSSVGVDLEIPERIVLCALQAARARELQTVLDPSPADRATDEMLALCTYLVPNPRETERLTDVKVRSEADAKKAGERLLERKVANVCIKLPDGGALLMSERGSELAKPPNVKVVDKTGAGDAFAAGLCVALYEDLQPRAALRMAVAAASFAVTRYGSQAAYPTRGELDKLLAEAPA
ncbi:MAG TPA: PfkB family carbohydrate kinase [Polyangiales bacterium]|nr:PfkB family carbohydrate kinase [Polyangiales bacterium]